MVWGIIDPMTATLLFRKRQTYRGGIVEMVVWRLPRPDADRPHGYKYRLVYVRAGKRIVGYDNERGKGDHRHFGDREESYPFVDVPTLLKDFIADIRRCA